MKTHSSSPAFATRWFCRLGAFSWALVAGAASTAADKIRDQNDFLSLSMEELGAIKITSVSKKTERLNAVPAAVSVITSDVIRGSGALTLPDVLRTAPGVSVAKVTASDWAVTVRGFNDTYAQKLLVLMDGRSIYTPLFSGTLWQTQDAILEDVDRIEVIRGPGGTVWGANAVNGVISIVSKPARETQGGLLTGGGGTDPRAFASVRYGAQLGTSTFFRIYGKHDDWSSSRLEDGANANDPWKKNQIGFRADWEPSTADRITLQGDMFLLRSHGTSTHITLPAFRRAPPPTGYNSSQVANTREDGGNLLGRWSRQLSEESDLSVQTYYDRSTLAWPLLGETRDTFDVDLRHRFQLGGRHEIVWGGGYRLSASDLKGGVEFNVNPASRNDQIINAFVQDEIKVVTDRLHWTVGTKIEHNDYTGRELQPGTRLSWTPTDKHTIWASVARAVRTPSQLEHDGQINLAVLPPSQLLPLPTVLSAKGSRNFKSEILVAHELGYRIQANRRLTFDFAAFVNAYTNLRSGNEHLDLGAAPNYARVVSEASNDVHGRTYGGEAAATWQAADGWRIYAQLSLIRANLREPASPLTGASRTPSIATPEYQASLHSSMDLGRHLTLDTAVRCVDRISEAGVAIQGSLNTSSAVPRYTTFDVRLAWRPFSSVELALVGQNLAGSHREFVPSLTSTQYSEVARSLYGKLTLKF